MSGRTLAYSLFSLVLLSSGAVSAAETRVQHREWIRKFENPGGTFNGIITVEAPAPIKTKPAICKDQADGTSATAKAC